MEQQALYLLITRHFNGHTSTAEEEFLAGWQQASPENKALYTQLHAIWEATELPHDEAVVNNALSDVKHRLGNRKGRVIGIWKYAAAVAIVVVSVGLMMRGLPDKKIAYKEYNSKRGEVLPCTLPDGTQVQLAPGSRLRYPESGSRTVLLEGQAFFHVAKDAHAPFAVQAGDVKVQVLGTRFNVSHYAKSSSTAVSLVDGKVRVQVRDQQAVALTPGQEISYDRATGQIEARSYDMETVTGWTSRLLVFKNDSLATVAARLEQLYDVNIIFEDPAIAGYKLFARFNNKPLNYILEVIKATDDLSYIVQGNTVRFTRTANKKR
ncbi:FecR domain-containing protein [Chitinophaga horti]|uniref:FecR domain-containing protein n=1 Tax=Chitinophaga horti TaxID=2920382 RepID=A0ABY6IUW2_9BACT|nr:FecR domain-containing protein [Chitinophaga horti]UYQ91003.1 FecR domain-containing protein [Chitinophaga horti]